MGKQSWVISDRSNNWGQKHHTECFSAASKNCCRVIFLTLSHERGKSWVSELEFALYSQDIVRLDIAVPPNTVREDFKNGNYDNSPVIFQSCSRAMLLQVVYPIDRLCDIEQSNPEFLNLTLEHWR
jgi:hypothetical protein